MRQAGVITAVLTVLCVWCVASPAAAQSTRYAAVGRAIVGRNLPYFNNRPLYCANTDAFVLAGDRPFARFARSDRHYGAFMLGVIRNGDARWLHEADEVTASYLAGRMTWTIRSSRLPGLTLTWDVLPMAQGIGLSARLVAEGARPGDQLVWAFGGATGKIERSLSWALDALTNPDVRSMTFVPEHTAGNQVRVDEQGFTLRAGDAKAPSIRIRTGTPTALRVADARQWASPTSLLASAGSDAQLPVGSMALENGQVIHWSIETLDGTGRADEHRLAPAEAFTNALARTDALANRVVVDTPDDRLDAAAAAAAAAIDGVWYPPVFVHGAMLWNSRFPGWRTVFGGTTFGWHERVRAQAGFYLPTQVTSGEKTSRAADPEKLLSKAALDSRFYGRGRILQDQGIYDMQSQLFDQLIHAWRWTGDPDLERQLGPALELHLEWLRECFDPDGDGTYESYINTWATDSVWFNGGGTPEETAYAYAGHRAARDLARRAGDAERTAHHEQALARIREGFLTQIWNAERGHPGLYREQGGHRRLHDDAWLLSVVVPMDAGLLNDEQALTSLRYTEWALQNDPAPTGGRRVWTSNFVPGIWSVRELWPGDNYHLALAYFQAGLAEDGWDVFRGTFTTSAFAQPSPGNLGSPQGGTDFGDCIHPFARTLVEGLFGFRPDYPNGVVHVAPKFPAAWDRASIRTPDFTLAFTRSADVASWRIALTRPSPIDLEVPVRARTIASVTVNGQPARYDVKPGYGYTRVTIAMDATADATITIVTQDAVPQGQPDVLTLVAGDRVRLESPVAPVTAFSDPQRAIEGAGLESGAVSGVAASLPAHPSSGPRAMAHATVLADVRVGDLPQRRVYHLDVKDADTVERRARSRVGTLPASAAWTTVDISHVLNADVRQIFQQQYVSPRPDTISVRIGTDGYSPWTFPHWKSGPPRIALDGVPALLDPGDPARLRTPQGVPFAWTGEARNIAFTSLWDNYPARLDIEVNRAAEAAWFLVAGSTNVMQGRIANAVLRLRYADGIEERVELVPPFDFWNLSTMPVTGMAMGQSGRDDYTAEVDAFAVPKPWPQTVRLGENCRAVLIGQRLRHGVPLQRVTLETLSQEVVIGLMGITLMNPAAQR